MLVAKKRKITLIVVLALTIVLGIFVVYFFLKNQNSHSTSDSADFINKINLERSQAEKDQESALNKDPEKKTQNDQNDKPDQPSTDTITNKLAVNVVLTNVGVSDGIVSASGFVTNIVESGGVCTFVFTKDGQQVTKTSETTQNPTSTTCKTVKFNSSELSSGKWTVGLTYNSNQATGSASNLMEVGV